MGAARPNSETVNEEKEYGHGAINNIPWLAVQADRLNKNKQNAGARPLSQEMLTRQLVWLCCGRVSKPAASGGLRRRMGIRFALVWSSRFTQYEKSELMILANRQ